MSWPGEMLRACLTLWKAFTSGGAADTVVNDEDDPPEERRWSPGTRPSREEEEPALCRHCDQHIGRSTVKICPGCGVILHDVCYDDIEGGDAYAT